MMKKTAYAMTDFLSNIEKDLKGAIDSKTRAGDKEVINYFSSIRQRIWNEFTQNRHWALFLYVLFTFTYKKLNCCSKIE